MVIRILVLQEMEENINNLQLSLEPYGYDLTIVDKISQAMSVLARNEMDVIVSAVFLRNESVFDFLRLCKADSRTAEKPFIFYCSKHSAFARSVRDGLQIAARAMGADKYITMEDFNGAALRDEIEDTIQRCERAAARRESGNRNAEEMRASMAQ